MFYWAMAGQTKSNSLYITITAKSEVTINKSNDVGMTLEVYRFNLTQNNKSVSLSTDDNGNLQKNVKVTGTGGNYFTLTYRNVNNKNQPIAVSLGSTSNQLTFEEMLQCDYNNLIDVITKYEEIYLIDASITNKDGSYMAKKVTYQQQAKL